VPEPTKPTCRTCPYVYIEEADPAFYSPERGFCRRHAPYTRAQSPLDLDNGWCGEHPSIAVPCRGTLSEVIEGEPLAPIHPTSRKGR